MPPLVVANAVRYACHGTYIDRPWVNIWDVIVEEGRPAAAGIIKKVAEAIADTYHTDVLNSMAQQWTFEGVRWVDLDSAVGETGSIVDTPATYTMPFQGAISSGAAAGNIAILVTKATTGGRAARKGRCFLAGVPTIAVAGNNLNGAWITALTAFCGHLPANVLAAGGTTNTELAVVHQPAASAPTASPVTSLQLQSRLATQRRRLRA